MFPCPVVGIHSSSVTNPAGRRDGRTDGCPEWRDATAGTLGRRFQANKLGERARGRGRPAEARVSCHVDLVRVAADGIADPVVHEMESDRPTF